MKKREPVPRGLSAASKAAARYLAKHPDAKAGELARKFDIDLSTVYRAPWWKQRGKAEQEAKAKGEGK